MDSTSIDFSESTELELVSNGRHERISVSKNTNVDKLKQKIMQTRGLSYPPNLYLADGRELLSNLTLEGVANNSIVLTHESDVPTPSFPHFEEFSQALEVTSRSLKKHMIQVNALVIGTCVLYSLVNKCKPYFQPWINMVFSYVKLAVMKKRD